MTTQPRHARRRPRLANRAIWAAVALACLLFWLLVLAVLLR